MPTKFAAFVGTEAEVSRANGQVIRERNGLWDWLDLIVLILSIVAIFFIGGK